MPPSCRPWLGEPTQRWPAPAEVARDLPQGQVLPPRLRDQRLPRLRGVARRQFRQRPIERELVRSRPPVRRVSGGAPRRRISACSSTYFALPVTWPSTGIRPGMIFMSSGAATVGRRAMLDVA